MKDDLAQNKSSKINAFNNSSQNQNEEIHLRSAKISEFLKVKKNANIDIDLSSLSKISFLPLIGNPLNDQKKIQKEEEMKESKITPDNESQKKYRNTDIKIPENTRKRKYRLHTNDVKLPSNISLLKKLCEKMEKNEKEISKPIFKFEEDENNSNIINNEEVDSVKKQLNNVYNKKEIYHHKKTSSQNLYSTREPKNEKIEVENLNKNNILKQIEINQESKNLTYSDNIWANKQKLLNQQQYKNRFKNSNNNYYNKNKTMQNNLFTENEIMKNSYFIKINAMLIEFSFMENINIQFENTMEDRSKSIINFNNNLNEVVLEIFDGHGGRNVSTYLQANFSKIYQKYLNETQKNIGKSLSMAFAKIDDDLRKQPNIENQGSTGTIIHIIRDKNNRLFVYNANVGDSRASLISAKRIIRLSKDHRTNDKEEKQRILAEGGIIINNRVNGELMLTRSFGDFNFKQNGRNNNIKTNKEDIDKFRKGVICEPFITQIEIDQSLNNQFLFLASDGVWDVISEEELQQLIKVNNHTKYLSSIIIERALIKQAWDNLSIFVVKLI